MAGEAKKRGSYEKRKAEGEAKRKQEEIEQERRREAYWRSLTPSQKDAHLRLAMIEAALLSMSYR